MDFGSLLYAAHKNEKSASKEINCYRTKFEPPKKEVKKKTNSLSVNVQKYLQKREEEERRKAEDEKRKKEELLALRSQDRKAFKRVQTMLKRTKSANKSVMEDAVDDVNTAITMAGPQQCDEDDYGYVSQEASAFYAKMMDKYSNLPPEEPKFSQSKKSVVKDLNAAKERVKAALHKVEEEEMMPHKRKRKSKSDKDGNEDDNDDRYSREPSPVEEPKPKKPKKMAPPPMDFSELLKLAEKKQFEPIQIEKKVKTEEDDRRPMTKKQKLEFEREREWREKKMERDNAKKRPPDTSLNRIPKISDSKEKPNGLGRIPKKSDNVDRKPRPESNEEKKRKNSYDSDSQQEKTNERERDYDGKSVSKDPSRNKSYKNGHQTSLERKPPQASIASNKLQSRKHSISDEESDNDRDGYSRPPNNSKDSKSHSSYTSKSDSSRPTQYSKSNSTDKKKLDERPRNGYNNDPSGSESEGDDRYKPRKYVPEPTHHQKYRPEIKNRADRNESRYPQPKPSKRYSCQESDNERSNSPKVYKNKYEMAESESEDDSKYKPVKKSSSQSKNDAHRNKYDMAESESEDDSKYKPSKKVSHQSNSDSHRKSSNSILERQLKRDHSPSPSRAKLENRSRPNSSSSNSKPESKKSSSGQSVNKEKKISSLFEGSDGDDSSNKYKSNRESDYKSKSSYDHERPKNNSSSETKFKIPKANSGVDPSRKPSQSYNTVKSSDNVRKYDNSDKNRTPKMEGNTRIENGFHDSKSNSEKNRSSMDKPKNGYHDSKSNSERSRPSIEKSKESPKDVNRKENSETSKKNSINAEEALKKNANVWAKPCNKPNQPPPKPASSGGLSESQIQRLREMNKKPAPLRPTENSPRPGASGRPMMGRPGEKPSLLKAAAAAAASRAAVQKKQQSPPPSREPQRPSRPSEKSQSSSRSSESTVNNSKPRQFPPSDVKPRQFPPSDVKPRQFPPSDVKPRQFPPNDLKPRQFPPKDVRRARQFPPSDVRRKARPRRIEDDSEEEYDSEMDDFIDDGQDMNAEDISREIQSIFGYDKSRYRYDDEDDECMESNFGQIDREELRSLRIGALEDLQELEKEKRMKERAKQRKKMMQKGR